MDEQARCTARFWRSAQRGVWWKVALALVLSGGVVSGCGNRTYGGQEESGFVQARESAPSATTTPASQVAGIGSPQGSLFVVDEQVWNMSYLPATRLTYEQALRLREILYLSSGELRAGLFHFYFGAGGHIKLQGWPSVTGEVRPLIEDLGLKVEEEDASGHPIPLTPDFEPIWRCGSEELVPAAEQATLSVTLVLDWGADETGTFFDGAMTVTNGGDETVSLPHAAIPLDVYEAGTATVLGRFTAWIELDGGNPPSRPARRSRSMSALRTPPPCASRPVDMISCPATTT